MQTLAPGKTEAGLTLVELLVVMLIIGMAAGMVVFAIPRGQSDVAKSALQVERDVASLREAAVSNVDTYALKSVVGGYARYKAEDGQWALLDTTVFPKTVAFELAAEGGWYLPEHRETLQIGSPPEQEREVFRPNILFAPDGSVTPFTVHLRDGRLKTSIRVDTFGKIDQEAGDER